MSKTKYTITNVEEKETKNGDPMITFELSNGDSVNIFQHHDRYGVLGEGDKIDQDELYVNSSGYVDLKDQPGDSRPESADPYEGKTNEMDEAMTRKEQSIKRASTASGATELLAAEIKAGHMDEGDIQKKDRWREWRTFLAGNWEADDEDFTNPEDVIEDL